MHYGLRTSSRRGFARAEGSGCRESLLSLSSSFPCTRSRRLAIISLLVVYGTVNLNEMAQFQGKLLFGFIPMWGAILQPLGMVIFIIAAFAETNRNPFDLAEGEKVVGVAKLMED